VLDLTVVPPADRADVGDRVNYTLTLTNDGNVTVTGATVADPLLGALTCTPAQPATLAPGAALVCTGSHTLTQADLNAGTVHNVATGDSDQTPPTDTPHDTPLPRTPALQLAKTAAPTTFAAVGETITYTYVITNTGNVTLGPAQFVVTDDKIGIPQGTPFNCGPAATTLLPTQTVTCQATYTITQADATATSVTNTATASGAGVTSNQASATVTGCVEGGQGLLGVIPGLPKVLFSNPGTLTYTAGIGAFSVTTNPTAVAFSNGTRALSDSPSLSINIRLNSNGTVAGGVGGPDFVVTGTVTNPNGTTYTGVLLTGEIASFGYRDGGTGLADQFDLRFRLTGGSLAAEYLPGSDIGVTVTSDGGNTFVGVFTANFQGNAKGAAGPVPPFVCR
jgi:uncharacterized repeat protein (TIGR01451 family)